MAEITKIVIAGTTPDKCSRATGRLKALLESDGFGVVTVEKPDVLRLCKDKIVGEANPRAALSEIFSLRLAAESSAARIAAALPNEKAVLLCCGELPDCLAYVSEADFECAAKERGLGGDFIRGSLDAVFFLASAPNGGEAVGADGFSAEDRKLIGAYSGTPHLRVIGADSGFDKLAAEAEGFLGVPEPLEIERKFLIEYPDTELLAKLETCRKVPIEQAYLSVPGEGNFRIRRRSEGESAVYIKTVKIKISDIKRIEQETYISEKEYYDYMSQKENIVGIISKDRYCIAWKSSYYELDVYPFWNDRATLEIELLSEEQEYELPEFVNTIREVTFEREYRNYALAQKFGTQHGEK